MCDKGFYDMIWGRIKVLECEFLEELDYAVREWKTAIGGE